MNLEVSEPKKVKRAKVQRPAKLSWYERKDARMVDAAAQEQFSFATSADEDRQCVRQDD